jgi:hypothetical protein
VPGRIGRFDARQIDPVLAEAQRGAMRALPRGVCDLGVAAQVVALAQVDQVGSPVENGDLVPPVSGAKDEAVRICAAAQRVVSGLADQHVLPLVAPQMVAARPAEEQVVAVGLMTVGPATGQLCQRQPLSRMLSMNALQGVSPETGVARLCPRIGEARRFVSNRARSNEIRQGPGTTQRVVAKAQSRFGKRPRSGRSDPPDASFRSRQDRFRSRESFPINI